MYITNHRNCIQMYIRAFNSMCMLLYSIYYVVIHTYVRIHIRTYVCTTNHVESLSYHITPLVANSLGSEHTHIHTHTHTHTHTQTCTHTDVMKSILINQVHTNQRPVHA